MDQEKSKPDKIELRTLTEDDVRRIVRDELARAARIAERDMPSSGGGITLSYVQT